MSHQHESSATPIIDWAAMEKETETSLYTYKHTNLVEILSCAKQAVDAYICTHEFNKNNTLLLCTESNSHNNVLHNEKESQRVLYGTNLDDNDNDNENNNNVLVRNGIGVIKVQAPMVRYSRPAFRQLCRSWGTDINYTHMMIAENFVNSPVARQAEFARYENENRLVVQFAAKSGPTLASAAELVARHCDGVDINCGCPQRWAMESGYGSALLQNVESVADMIKCVRNNVSFTVTDRHSLSSNAFPCSVKMRLLYNNNTSNVDVARSVDFARQCAAAGASWITVHGRTPSQESNAPVHYDIIQLIQENVTIPVIANGAIHSLSSAVQTALTCHVGSVMVGNALLDNPACLHVAEVENNMRLTYQLPHWQRWQNTVRQRKQEQQPEHHNDCVISNSNHKSQEQENEEHCECKDACCHKKASKENVRYNLANNNNNKREANQEQQEESESEWSLQTNYVTRVNMTPLEVISDFIRAAIATNLASTTTVQHTVRMARYYLTHPQRVQISSLKNNYDVLHFLQELDLYTGNGHLYTANISL